jgi:hypothetical protein
VFARWWELALILVAASIGLCAVIFYFDNVHRATTNGLWKSLDVIRWVERAPDRVTDPANLLYYPVVSALVRLLPAETFGAVWQRMAFVNAFFAAIVLALTYAIGVRLFRSRQAALVACGCQLSMGFFLLLSTINEDIMPGYVWFVAAIACAVVPRRLGPLALVLAAQCVALAWLFHWSLQLPAVGAFVLGIAAWAGDARRAVSRVAIFCIALLPLPAASAWLSGLPWWNGFGSGKGLDTGWGGFAANKLVLMWSGIGQSVAGGRNVATTSDILSYPYALWTAVSVLVIAALFAAWIREGWRRRADPTWRLAATLLVSAFVLGEGMNLYIQPQDPQMQIQPMTWFPFAAACVYWLAARQGRRISIPLRAGLAIAVILLFVGNLRVYAGERHTDSTALANLRSMESLAAPERTMFLMHGFEGMSTWLTLGWGRGLVWPNEEAPEPGPHRRQFNVIYIASEATVFPDRPPSESAHNIVRLIERALDEGYEVMASDIWSASEEAWVDSFASVSGPEKPRAIRAALHDYFTGTPVGTVPGWTSLHRITRKEP